MLPQQIFKSLEKPTINLQIQYTNLITIDMLPVSLNIIELCGTETFGKPLYQHLAKFHKSYTLKFGNEKLERAIKKSEKLK